MKAFLITEQKEFMNLLLRSEVFDNFLLKEAEIHGSVDFSIDGSLHKDFYTTEELEELHLSELSYQSYRQLRPICYELIRGKHAPSYFKFVLQLSPQNLQNTIQAAGVSISPTDIGAVYFNILFQNSTLLNTTGISYQTFVLDKAFEKEWDRFAGNFLTKNGVVYMEQ